tara:strand:- start:470 stop:730 length:261 start_codon:yes stop_codon:yes gene_type:complete
MVKFTKQKKETKTMDTFNDLVLFLNEENETIKEQLQHLQNEIDSITLDNIEDNNDPKTIKNQFNIIRDNIKDIRNGKKPYRTKEEK